MHRVPLLRLVVATIPACSVLTVSHDFDGFLRSVGRGFVAPRCQPWGSSGFKVHRTGILFALLKVPLQRSRQASRAHFSERAPACFTCAPVVASKLPLRPVAEGFHPKRSPLRCFHPTKRSPLAQRTPHHLARPFRSSCDDRLGEHVHSSVLPSRRWMFICIIRPRYRPPCEGLPRSRLTRSRFREMHLILSTSRP